ncbi:glutathione S-transferase family protein [Gimibacter soli]|uniref:Glutathione S-transferase family protein n=1 Tax=Gimibacter soli TaxID=3024400 RepID=A0AAF0BMB5_9PROT|nr:glutathione S-transferase family protein [Gimibacter soli]WCL54330.1 glutathione S-transferase family protein [Gimibacter soli]
MALTLHYHPLSSYCHKVLIGLYELDVPFTPAILNLMDPAERERFLEISPMGKMPALVDETRGETATESSIIIEYLDQHYPGARPLLPTDADACLMARKMDRVFDLYVMTPVQKIIGDGFRPEGGHDTIGVAEAHTTLKAAYGMLDRHFYGRTWAAGDRFSIADCAAAPALFYARTLEPFGEDNDLLAAYFERLCERPSFARVLTETRPWFHMYPRVDAVEARFLAD